MALARFGFIVSGSGLDPRIHRAEMSSPTFRMTVVGVSDPRRGAEVATRLADEGVQLIELCGGFGPLGTAAVVAALGGRVPVGAVAYGPEAIASLASLFSEGSH
ncbi:MAG: hypothetical protein KC731_21885 [Myxococcales bacterium]|nr:hypothetical protein [Myxococcales bacterium]